jgi:hypothetical protein
METKKSKTVFIEYSSYNKGQHFMTVVQTQDHKRIIIGRVYKVYDKENKKTHYYATDFEGNQVFKNITELYALKQKFIEHGPNLAMVVPSVPGKSRQSSGLVIPQKAERKLDLEKIRDKKSSKEKTKEVKNTDGKTNNDQKEKEQDSKRAERYKDVDQKLEEHNSKENIPENTVPDTEMSAQEETFEDQTSERENELEQIRDDNEDRDQDLEIDM